MRFALLVSAERPAERRLALARSTISPATAVTFSDVGAAAGSAVAGRGGREEVVAGTGLPAHPATSVTSETVAMRRAR